VTVARGACLVAGCGDVGSRAAALMVARGDKVYGLRRSALSLPAGVLPLQADLTDPASLGALPDDVDRVIFLPTPGQRDEAAYRGLFLHGLRNLLTALDARRPVRRVLFASSSAVYGEHHGKWVDEVSLCQPLAFNGSILLETERWLAQRPGSVSLRLSGLYGPGRTHLLGQVARGEARTPAGARQWTNRIHVEDAAAACVHVLGLADVEPCYVVSDDEPCGVDEIHLFMAQRLGVPAPAVGSGGARLVGNKRLRNARLRASGFVFSYPDFRAGYGALLPLSLQRS
jgi:nucleoside-diphosphate-sugar epimerase